LTNLAIIIATNTPIEQHGSEGTQNFTAEILEVLIKGCQEASVLGAKGRFIFVKRFFSHINWLKSIF
jgi:hypothetical protein